MRLQLQVYPCMYCTTLVASPSAYADRSSALAHCTCYAQAFKPQNSNYKLFWPEQSKFVRMAAKFGATIVPFGAIGADEGVTQVLDAKQLESLPFLKNLFLGGGGLPGSIPPARRGVNATLGDETEAFTQRAFIVPNVSGADANCRVILMEHTAECCLWWGGRLVLPLSGSKVAVEYAQALSCAVQEMVTCHFPQTPVQIHTHPLLADGRCPSASTLYSKSQLRQLQTWPTTGRHVLLCTRLSSQRSRVALHTFCV